MAVTRSDVARAAGVSPAVVSYVINSGTRPVSAAARARVGAAIARLNYRPNAIARALRGGATQSVGLLTPSPLNPFYTELSGAIEHELFLRGYLLFAGVTNYDTAREQRYLRSFIDRKVDGLIFSSGMSLSSASIVGLDGTPLIVLDGSGDQQGISSVQADDMSDAAYVVQHLQNDGHALIGCVAGPPTISSSLDRVRGWREQLKSRGLGHGEDLVAHADISEAGGNVAAHALLGEHGRPWAMHGQRPSALFVSSDVQAIGAIYACYELRLRIPDDVAIVSFGGIRAASFASPPLTTMRQPVDIIACTAVDHLVACIEDRSTAPIHLELKGNLVVGRSCGCAPGLRT